MDSMITKYQKTTEKIVVKYTETCNAHYTALRPAVVKISKL